MRIRTVALVVGIVMWMTAPAWAGTLDYNFADGYSGQQGTSITYTTKGFSITASGFQEQWSGKDQPTDLYVKTNGGDESGLGIANENDHEIDTNQFIQLDLSSLTSDGIFGGNLSIGSVQSGEGYAIYTSGTSGQIGDLELTGIEDMTPFFVSWTAADPYVGITAWIPKDNNWRNQEPHSDVLVMSLDPNPSPTPEPASLLLMGTGLFGLAFVFRKYGKVSPAK